ncbi:SRPBCC family protein [Phycicoccus endophyticus]|uniref:SRPBCC family protein n=1 Tax=Phycicoccus endophyticus TaxID=1690220 RepID=A0A7G9QZA7_9MICO|nr:SRPBCC family protein [Phycicoccus endophyticus]NHI19035.1 carbon monoxide dehydrogenase [Phycicoccus endophyticus]QNN48682.1 SRPBCC family protein [Phycicoccus endophyticus]GGL32362.1 hypothetical protein GCM10012283_13330 [Phycicoccus endophyticus]
MELRHDFTVPADVDTAWATFTDLEQVGGCFPGATVTEVTDEGFSGTVKVKLGPIALQYAGTGRFLERDDAAHHAVIEAKGKDKRGNGTAGATVTVRLEPAGEGTRVDVVTDLAVTGKPAQFGRGVMQDVSDKLLGQFVACIEGRLAGPAAPPSTAPVAAPAPEGESAPVSPAVGAPAPDAASAEPEPAPTPEPPPSGAAEPATAAPSAPRAEPPRSEDAIDLGTTVLPVLLRTYAPYVVVGVVGILIGWLIGRG